MSSNLSLYFVYDRLGNKVAVQLPISLWLKIESHLAEFLKLQETDFKENINEFNSFLASWDYLYPYDPSVKCPSCNAHSEDWRKDNPRLFYLSATSLGGLLVFRCACCGGIIRHKYFKKHSEVEYTSAAK